jgi:oligopeptide/dipeptide ABC transporter ATP-binding protein
MTAEVLRVRNLRVRYHTPRGTVKAVEDVSFSLRQGEKLGLVGESGSGKSTIALALMRLIRPPGQIESGEVLLDNRNLLALSDEQMRLTRFARISLVPQGAMNSLNPVMRIKHQLGDTIRAHDARIAAHDVEKRIAELMEWVGLRKSVANMYPHELSGGMKQRVCIAMGICLSPQVIIADEPTSALDVVVQRQVMDTLDSVQAQLGAAVILVGHDMGLMAQFVDRVAVMYCGRLVEVGPVEQIFDESLHPYTRLLIATLPSLEIRSAFRGIPGIAASPLDPPTGCTFHPRCPWALDRCSREAPVYREALPDRWAACHLVM